MGKVGDSVRTDEYVYLFVSLLVLRLKTGFHDVALSSLDL